MRRFVSCLLVGLGSLLAACGGSDDGSSGGSSPPARVRAVRPGKEDLTRRVALPARVRANYEVTLYARQDGYVRSIAKDRGDRVRKDEIIAVLDVPELEQQLERSRAEMHLKKATLKRLEGIRGIEKTAVTDHDLEVARAEHAMAEAEVRRLEVMAKYAQVQAPFAGTVTERFVDPGDLVKKGRVVSLVDASKVRVLVDVPENEVPFLAPGTPGKVIIEALAGEPFDAKVARIAESLEPSALTMRAELEVANPKGEIKPGMSATVVMDVEVRKGVTTIPEDAAVRGQGEAYVFVAEEGKARKVEVRLGVADKGLVEVLEGLQGGESVILPSAVKLDNGMKIQLIEEGGSEKEE